MRELPKARERRGTFVSLRRRAVRQASGHILDRKRAVAGSFRSERSNRLDKMKENERQPERVARSTYPLRVLLHFFKLEVDKRFAGGGREQKTETQAAA